jgi:hypothetical protein
MKVSVRTPNNEAQICLTSGRIPKDISGDIQVFPNDQRLNGAELESLEGILNTKTISACVLADFVEVLLDQLLFLNELDVRERFRREFDGLASLTLINKRCLGS